MSPSKMWSRKESVTFWNLLNTHHLAHFKTCHHWDFPGGPVVKTASSAAGVGLIPDWGIEIPRAAQPKK